jgi:hypothetical protein
MFSVSVWCIVSLMISCMWFTRWSQIAIILWIWFRNILCLESRLDCCCEWKVGKSFLDSARKSQWTSQPEGPDVTALLSSILGTNDVTSNIGMFQVFVWKSMVTPVYPTSFDNLPYSHYSSIQIGVVAGLCFSRLRAQWLRSWPLCWWCQPSNCSGSTHSHRLVLIATFASANGGVDLSVGALSHQIAQVSSPPLRWPPLSPSRPLPPWGRQNNK